MQIIHYIPVFGIFKEMFLIPVMFSGEEWGQEWMLNGKNNRNRTTNLKGNTISNGSGKTAFFHSGPHSFLVIQPNAMNIHFLLVVFSSKE